MKILLATDTYFPYINGGSYFVIHLAHGLRDRGHQVFVVTMAESFQDVVNHVGGITEYRIRSIPLPTYNKFRVSPLVLSRQSIVRAVKAIAPDVVHLQHHFYIGRGVFEVARELGIPAIGTNHSLPDNVVYYFHLPRWGGELVEKFGWKQFRDVYDQLDVVAAPTKTAADITQLHLRVRQVIPVSNGIDLARYRPDHDAEYLRERYRLPARNVILYTGRLDREKRIEVLLEALVEVRKTIDAHLVITGIGGVQRQLREHTRKIGLTEHVTFTGFVSDEDFPAIYCAAHVFAIASVAELQSLVTMEAVASGLPVVAVNAKALPELCHDGENGFIFAEDDVAGCARGLLTILGDDALRQRMSQASLEIISHHSLDKTISTYEGLYRRAIAMHADPSAQGVSSPALYDMTKPNQFAWQTANLANGSHP
ncbi:MAG: glycosyltransferase [Patescibacteria group bacterium]